MENAEKARIFAVLDQNPWFAGLPPALKAALIAKGRVVEVARGQWVYGAGDDITGLYAVLAGSVDIMMSTVGGNDVLMDVAPAGRVFSQALGPRIVTALANEDSLLLFVADHVLREIGRGHPEMARHFTGLLYEQLSGAAVLAVNMIHLPPRKRIAARLLFLAGNEARDGAAVQITQNQLAELTGLSRKTVNAHLADFAARGLVEPGYAGLALRNLAGLRRVAQSP
jgi:CRP/FNR family transcriptional regulator, cyclic AMP receptor protein